MRITFLIQSEKTKIFSCILITFLLLAFAPLVEAQNQRVHLTGTDNSLRTAFEQIEKQTKMSVDYDAKILDTSRPRYRDHISLFRGRWLLKTKIR